MNKDKKTFKTYRFSTFQEMLEVVPKDRFYACLKSLGFPPEFVDDYISDYICDVCNGDNESKIEWTDDGSGDIYLDGEKIVVEDY